MGGSSAVTSSRILRAEEVRRSDQVDAGPGNPREQTLSWDDLPAQPPVGLDSSRGSSSHSRTSRGARSRIEPRITAPSPIAKPLLHRYMRLADKEDPTLDAQKHQHRVMQP
jgi:hypothetical protein